MIKTLKFKVFGIETEQIEYAYYREKEDRIDTLHPSDKCMDLIAKDYPEDEYIVEFIAGSLDNGTTDTIQKTVM